MQGQSSTWHDFVQSLPHITNSPVLWGSEEQSELLQGSPALPEAQARAQALSAEWDSIHQQLKADPSQHTDSEAHVFPALYTNSSATMTHCLRVCACPWLLSRNRTALAQRHTNCTNPMLLCRAALPTQCLSCIADKAGLHTTCIKCTVTCCVPVLLQSP